MSEPLTPAQLQTEADQFRTEFQAVRDAVGKVIVGQQRVVEATLTALLCGGNVLLEGVPGLGKTELVKALSQVLKLEFRRIQFTPDLMPADVIGTNIMTTDDAGKYRFEFRQGPIFTQLLLADEINRATPKTQSALLETMQEGTVTTGGTTYTLARRSSCWRRKIPSNRKVRSRCLKPSWTDSCLRLWYRFYREKN